MIDVNTNALKGLKYDLDSGCISDMNAAGLETGDEDEGESFSLIQISGNFLGCTVTPVIVVKAGAV